MERPGRGLLLASVVMALASCKGKASSSGESQDAATTAAEASAASATGSAAPSAPPPPALATLVGFEGEIDLAASSVSSTKPPTPISLLVKGDKLRVDAIPGSDTAIKLGGKAYLLARVADKKLDVVVDARKQVLELDLNNPDALNSLQKSAAAVPGHPHAKPEPPPKLTETGTKESIAGYTCEDWDVTGTKDSHKKVSMCVADIASTFFHLPLTGLSPDYGFAGDLLDGQHFPLRFIGYDERTGAESGRLEVTKIDPHPNDASKFDMPVGYETVNLLQMLQMFTGGGRVLGVPSGMPSGIPGMPPNMPNMPMGPRHARPHF